MTDDLRYPIGAWVRPTVISALERTAWINAIAALPAELRAATAGLTDAQLDTPYRPGGWTVRQVVHHLPDSHLNAYVRFKLALTEPDPTIRPYDEGGWAKLPDSALPVDVSLRIVDAVHERWVALLRALPADAFSRPFQHPESGAQTLDTALSTYAWHGRHHVAHVMRLRARAGW